MADCFGADAEAPLTPLPDHWDYYEISFSVDGDEDKAFALYEQFEKLPGVVGAVMSGGNDGPHPFTDKSVERAAQAMFAAQDHVSIERIRELLPIALNALYVRAAGALPRQQAQGETDAD